jgi:3-dehydroquinate synthase
MMNTGHAPIPRHLVWGDIGHARFPVCIGPGEISRIGDLWTERAVGDAALVVFDGAVAAHAQVVEDHLRAAGVRVVPVAVPPGEPSKSLAQVESICRVAARHGIRRTDAVVAVGGGVIGDLAGFVAASYQRGIALVHVPTTLLAMVDSAIGGKTGVDLPEAKNYVGAIWQPAFVVMDTDVLGSLPARELSCGFAEVVKYGLLDSFELFARVEAWPAPLPGDPEALVNLIRDCVAHKLDVVSQDEREQGLRASLNLGHTVGHGIEAAAGYGRYHHGEAISLGLLAALRVAHELHGAAIEWRARTAVVLERHGLPTRLAADVSADEILAAMGRDKKASATSFNMVLIQEPGAVLLRQDPPREAVVAAIEELR